MILIVTRHSDETAAAVLGKLKQRGADVRCVDLADLPTRGALSWWWTEAGKVAPMLQINGQVVDLRRVRAIWDRATAHPVASGTLATGGLRAYARKEMEDAWFGTIETLPCLRVPGPRWHELRAEQKPLQWTLATELGLEIPPTLLTNRPTDFLEFYRRHHTGVVSKALHNRVVRLPGPPFHGEHHIYTEPVSARDAGYAQAVRYCPLVLQPYVRKRIELRVTVVRRRVFAAEIHSQHTNHTRYDWRHDDLHMRCRRHDLPPEVAGHCAELVARLGLCFGVIDMIVTPNGRYVFLEINPNGQWLWTERTGGLPISDAIADLLMSATRRIPTHRRRGAPRPATAIRPSVRPRARRASPDLDR